MTMLGRVDERMVLELIEDCALAVADRDDGLLVRITALVQDFVYEVARVQYDAGLVDGAARERVRLACAVYRYQGPCTGCAVPDTRCVRVPVLEEIFGVVAP